MRLSISDLACERSKLALLPPLPVLEMLEFVCVGARDLLEKNDFLLSSSRFLVKMYRLNSECREFRMEIVSVIAKQTLRICWSGATTLFSTRSRYRAVETRDIGLLLSGCVFSDTGELIEAGGTVDEGSAMPVFDVVVVIF